MDQEEILQWETCDRIAQGTQVLYPHSFASECLEPGLNDYLSCPWWMQPWNLQSIFGLGFESPVAPTEKNRNPTATATGSNRKLRLQLLRFLGGCSPVAEILR